jgi:hypothetical protein
MHSRQKHSDLAEGQSPKCYLKEWIRSAQYRNNGWVLVNTVTERLGIFDQPSEYYIFMKFWAMQLVSKKGKAIPVTGRGGP